MTKEETDVDTCIIDKWLRHVCLANDQSTLCIKIDIDAELYCGHFVAAIKMKGRAV